jgi:hypothetical protein
VCNEVGGSLKTDLLNFSYNYGIFENCFYAVMTLSDLIIFAKYKGYFKIQINHQPDATIFQLLIMGGRAPETC